MHADSAQDIEQEERGEGDNNKEYGVLHASKDHIIDINHLMQISARGRKKHLAQSDIFRIKCLRIRTAERRDMPLGAKSVLADLMRGGEKRPYEFWSLPCRSDCNCGFPP